MQVSSQSSLGSQSVDREIYQAVLLKRAIKAEGDQQLKLLDSATKEPEAVENPKVGVRLNAKA